MFLPKVAIAHLSQHSDYFSFVNFLMTCKTYYKYKPFVKYLYGYNKIDYTLMTKTLDKKYDSFNFRIIDKMYNK